MSLILLQRRLELLLVQDGHGPASLAKDPGNRVAHGRLPGQGRAPHEDEVRVGRHGLKSGFKPLACRAGVSPVKCEMITTRQPVLEYS